MSAARRDSSGALAIAGIDVGGTFTDVVLFEPETGRLTVAKVPSTPADQSVGVMAALRAVAGDLGRIGRVAHGTTVSTNALLEGKGARVALVTTQGFADALEIGRTRRMIPSQYDPAFVRPRPLVERPLRFELPERLDAAGNVLVPLDMQRLPEVLAEARAQNVQAIAVCFLHAYVNPAHEQQVAAQIARRDASLAVATSAEVVPEFREYERFSTTVINAALMPVMGRYIGALDQNLEVAGCRGELTTMASSGGTMDSATACKLPVRTILSGPAGGVAGSLWIAEAAGLANFVTCDMGGTSTDVCLVEDGKPATTTEIAFGGHPIKGLQIAINTVGAGGGSIAYVEAGSTLRVGPRSAGADPGPACYGRGGTEPTVTDANLVLGRIRESHPLGGHIRLDRARAAAAVGALAATLRMDATRLAEGIIDLAVARMASAIREITIEKGRNPADFALLAFGGAGPMHAVALAAELGMREVVVPLFPGNLSALGLVAADQRYELVRTFFARLDEVDADAGRLTAALAAARAEAEALLAAHGVPAKRMRVTHGLDMRYARQAFEIGVDITGLATPCDIRAAFLATYARHYGHADAAAEIEIVNLRTTAIGITDKPAHVAMASPAGADPRIALTAMHFGGVAVEAVVYDRARLAPGVTVAGPAIIEEAGATTVLPPGWSAAPDAFGNLRLARGG